MVPVRLPTRAPVVANPEAGDNAMAGELKIEAPCIYYVNKTVLYRHKFMLHLNA
jgi:hypothetical protein